MTGLVPVLLLAAGAGPTAPAPPPEPIEQLHQAHATYEYGDYAASAKILDALTQARSLERTVDQIEALRLLGLSRFFLNQFELAVHAFVELLSLDPDFQLDPLYVPPQAVAFFETVRRNNKDLLDPIRLRRRATQEASAQEEAARQRFLSQGTAAPPRVVHERVERPSKLLALLPFGVGQFQNGDTGWGVAFAVAEALTAGTSIGCFAWVETNSQAGFFPSSTYRTALAVRGVQLGTGIAFAALWGAGIAQALIALKPPTVVPEESPEPRPASPPLKVGAGFTPLPGGGLGSLQLTF